MDDDAKPPTCIFVFGPYRVVVYDDNVFVMLLSACCALPPSRQRPPPSMMSLEDRIHCSVARAVASPSYGVLLEEATRNERQVVASKLLPRQQDKEAGSGWRWRFWAAPVDDNSGALWPTSTNEDMRLSGLLFSPEQMKRRAQRRDASPCEATKAVLIGGTGFLGKFLAEELKNKHMDVVVVARSIDNANRIFQPIFDGTAERRRRESMGYVVKPSPARGAPLADASMHRATGERGPKPPQLSCVQADVTQPADLPKLQAALHDASLVFYLASAKDDVLMQSNNIRAVDLEGLKTCIRACEAADAHLVVLSPLFAWQSRWRPVYLWYNYFASKRGYLRVSRERERLFFNDDGSPGAYVRDHAPTLRFSLVRVNHLVFPSFQAYSVIAKNNRIDDPFHFVDVAAIGGKGFLTGGDLCARHFANLLTRLLCYHRSCVNARIDVCGAVRRRSGLIDINSARDLDAAFQGLRHEC